MSLALFLLAALAPPAETESSAPPPMAGTSITYQVRVLEMHGLGWRHDHAERLRPIDRPGPIAAWTVDRAVVQDLAREAGRIIQAPRVAAFPEATARVAQSSTRKYVRRVKRGADRAPGAIKPELGETREELHVGIAGRQLDQGVLARVELADTWIAAMHAVGGKAEGIDVQVPEVVRDRAEGEWLIPEDGAILVSLGAHTAVDPAGKAVVRERLVAIEASSTPSSAPVASDLPGDPFAPGTGALPPLPEVTGAAPATGSIPTIDSGVPPGTFPGLMGENTTDPAPDRQEAFTDRDPANIVAQVERGQATNPGSLGDNNVKVAEARMPGMCMSAPRNPIVAGAPLPMPAMPGRSLPRAFAPDGSPVATPEKPDEEIKPAMADASAEPRPSPQAKVDLGRAGMDPGREALMHQAEQITRRGMTGDAVGQGPHEACGVAADRRPDTFMHAAKSCGLDAAASPKQDDEARPASVDFPAGRGGGCPTGAGELPRAKVPTVGQTPSGAPKAITLTFPLGESTTVQVRVSAGWVPGAARVLSGTSK